MKTVPAGEFKANCPRLIEEVSQTAEPLLITKRGKPFAEIHPVDESDLREELADDLDTVA
jgi:prevent-host-death family protein